MTRAALAAILLLLLTTGEAFAQEAARDRFPFFPSLMNSKTGAPLSSDLFLKPTECRGCHAGQYGSWVFSMHALARVDPIFVALWEKGAKEAGEATGRLCAGCHMAPGVLSGELTMGEDGHYKVSKTADYGVHCHVCHSVVESSMRETPTGLPQNASIVFDPGKVMRGPFDDSKPLWHEAAYSELHTKAEFCGNCHNVFHPVSNFTIENTYTEWKNSPYAQKGIVCQDCHMMPLEKAVSAAATMTRPVNPGKASPVGPQRPNIFTHDFVGANFTVPLLLGNQAQAEKAMERLKTAADLSLKAPEALKRGKSVDIGVTVTNKGAGHNLPTSLTEVRQMWLEVRALDGAGAELFLSGGLEKNGDLGAEAVVFQTVAVDEKGEHTFLPWKMNRFTKNTTIPPKGSATNAFTFSVPENAVGPVEVRVRLRYRSYPQALANELLGEKAITLPVVDMAAVILSLPLE